ncbi:protein kinase [Granulicella sp. L46]|uniref:protein kinase domain-containing protein n=1 Tax=Granulicella sp. L46 TaxID=1641865 RepID=UPI00131E1E9B|nr:protein kinase [Granulicella sp. L46]
MDMQDEAAERLFGKAVELPRDRRSAFLDGVCAGEPALRRVVEDLLDRNDRLSGFLSEPAYVQGAGEVGMASQTVVLPSGVRLMERYVISGRLGAGGMGVVYRARDEKLDRDVAIKMLQRGLLTSDEARARFRREAQALAKLNHAHIAAVYDVIEQDGADCIVMELVEGESLAAKLSRGALPVKEATIVALQVAEALVEAHEQGVIHRDLKPGNVMITSKGRAKVLDFGLARLLLGPADVTQAGGETVGVLGTPLYMSPEQAMGQTADARSDLWSLGVTYYESLTGIEPFRRSTTLAILRAITDETVRPLREVSPQTPALAEQVVARALEKDAELRYQRAGDFATDLQRVLRDLEPGRRIGSVTPAEPVAGVGVSAAPARRLWLRWIAFLAAVLVVVGIVLFLQAPASATGELASTQISFSNEDKLGPLRTDGARLYFENHIIPSAMSVSGGIIAPIPGLSSGMYLVDVSADGSKVLAWAQSLNNESNGGWFMVGSSLGGAFRRIGTVQEANPGARWSSDGKSIYFVQDEQVWVMDEDGDHARVLWKSPEPPTHLAVSPDGTQLSVTLSWARIWLVGSDGKNPHPLDLDWPSDVGEFDGQWTPDGRHFVFNSGREGRGNVYELIKPRWFEFWKKPWAIRLTGNQLNITDAVPARDSKSLFVLGRVDTGTMQVFDPRAGKLVPFLGGLPALEFVVSPDQQWMAYTDYPSLHLWKSRLDGSDAVQLTKVPAYMEEWSPDGKWIAYSDWRKIYRISADGGVPEKVMPEGDFEVIPTWSPDGKSIYFNRFDGLHKPDGLYIADVASGKAVPMPGAEKYYIPAWSPDGRYLLAMLREPLSFVIYSPATKQWRTLMHFDAREGFYAWSPDSRFIYFTQNQTHAGLYRVSVPDGVRERVSDVPDVGNLNAQLVSVTADGQPAVMANSGAAQVYSLQWK